MTLFVISVITVLIVSGLCSLTEAALYNVPMPYVRKLAESGSTAGKLLTKFKKNMEQPITAILIVNTVANTAGATVAGAQARHLFGDSAIIWFSAVFTLSVLFFSEIMPKVAGVTYNRLIAPAVSVPLNLTIELLRPLVWVAQRLARILKPSQAALVAPEEEVQHLAMLSAEEGSILPVEAELVRNVLKLNEVKAREIMTPRTVVCKALAEYTVKDISEEAATWPSRIPIHSKDEPEDWVGVVLRDDILNALAKDNFDVTLQSLSRPLGFVPESIPGHLLLNEFLTRQAHLLGVVDEYGAVVGVVTLEDVMETLIGREIVDETDVEVDMQALARRRASQRHGGMNQSPSSPG